MSKFDKYFLPHLLRLDDHFCKYYVQNPSWCPQEILDVPCIILDHPEDAQELIQQCLEYDAYTTIRGLRVFLSEDCSECYQVHRMDDRQVIYTTALQLTMRALKIVIEPKFGWSVDINGAGGQPDLPISLHATPDPETIFEAIKQELDGLVAEQKQKYAQYEAVLAKMTQAQKSALYSKKAGSGLYEGTIGGIVDLAKAFPGFYVGYLKTLWRIRNLPQEASKMLLQALFTGDTSPIEAQIDQIVKPVAQTFDQADQLKSMLMVLFGDERTMAMLGDFAQRYWDATHPLERTEIGATAASDIVVTILLAIVTVGVGAAANIAAKAPRLAKLAKLLEKLAGILKSTGSRHHLPTKEAPGSAAATTRSGSSKPSSRNARQGGIAEVQTPEYKPAPGAPDRPRDSMDKTKEKDYGESDKIEGPKTTKPIADKKFKRKHLDGDSKDPYTLKADGKPMGAKEGAMPSEMYGLREPPHGHEKLIKEGYPDIATRGDYKNFSTIEPKELPPGTKIYRIVDEGSSEISKGNSGCYWAKELPKNKTEWRSNYAVKDSWNDNGYYVEHTAGPDGLKVWEGKTAGQEYLEHKGKNFYLEGGDTQLYVGYGKLDNLQPKHTNWPDV